MTGYYGGGVDTLVGLAALWYFDVGLQVYHDGGFLFGRDIGKAGIEECAESVPERSVVALTMQPILPSTDGFGDVDRGTRILKEKKCIFLVKAHLPLREDLDIENTVDELWQMTKSPHSGRMVWSVHRDRPLERVHPPAGGRSCYVIREDAEPRYLTAPAELMERVKKLVNLHRIMNGLREFQ